MSQHCESTCSEDLSLVGSGLGRERTLNGCSQLCDDIFRAVAPGGNPKLSQKMFACRLSALTGTSRTTTFLSRELSSLLCLHLWRSQAKEESKTPVDIETQVKSPRHVSSEELTVRTLLLCRLPCLLEAAGPAAWSSTCEDVDVHEPPSLGLKLSSDGACCRCRTSKPCRLDLVVRLTETWTRMKTPCKCTERQDTLIEVLHHVLLDLDGFRLLSLHMVLVFLSRSQLCYC